MTHQDAPAGPVLGDLVGVAATRVLAWQIEQDTILLTEDEVPEVARVVVDALGLPALLSSAREEVRRDCAAELAAQLADERGSGWDLTERMHVLVHRWSS